MTTKPFTQPRPSAEIPRIELLSWLGLESAVWGVILVHLAKWAGNALYYGFVQCTWYLPTPPGGTPFAFLALKDPWDRLPVHLENLFGVHWFAGQSAPAWWVTDRHDIRDVSISLSATILVAFLFSKPRYPLDDKVTGRQYINSLLLALVAAALPIAAVAVLAWKQPWLMHHGWQVPASYGGLASEINGFIAAGTWITVVMGITGGLAAKPFLRRPADDVQWFFAERSAGKIALGQNKLRGVLVIGTPVHRRRVYWLLDNRPSLPMRSPWLVRGLLIIGFLTLLAAGFGAWLTIVGPAAVH